MRRTFFQELYKQMKANPDIWVVTGDLGYIGFDRIRDEFPERFVNAGASEQAMVGIAVGLALKGKIPFVYTISSFFLRAAETINLYLHHEQIPVHLIGSGRDQDYAHDGYSHDGTMAQNYLRNLDLVNYYPDDKKEVKGILEEMIKNKKPSFLSLRR